MIRSNPSVLANSSASSLLAACSTFQLSCARTSVSSLFSSAPESMTNAVCCDTPTLESLQWAGMRDLREGKTLTLRGIRARRKTRDRFRFVLEIRNHLQHVRDFQ